ncbi:MAG: nicotinate phosphoribosyltransferase [Cyclobacteriaceae bacterium]
MIDFTATYTDQYQLTMAQAYFLRGRKEEKAIFDYFFRKLPFGGGYAIFAGLETLLDVLEKFHFSKKDLAFLKVQGFDHQFIKYLENFRFTGKLHSAQEGDLVFPTRPVLQVESNIIEAQVIETLLLNLLNFQTLIATKASRMHLVAGDTKLVDFGLRRAQGPGGYYASRASVIGGFHATSNVRAGQDFNIPVSGTMAHSYVQSYDNEINAFRDFALSHPDNCVLLVDTYSTLKSGVPNAIKIGREMAQKGQQLKGIRLDSGDLAFLAHKSRKMLDKAGLDQVKIVASNQLDEKVIKSLLEEKAPIDIFGVGTQLVVGLPDAALDGVYKLAFAGGKPRLKLSETKNKITIPHEKQVYRIRNQDGSLIGADVITLRNEENVEGMHHIFELDKLMDFKGCKMEPLLHQVMENGKRVSPKKSLGEIATFSKQRLNELPASYKRFENPHIYKVGLSKKLKEEREILINQYKK